MTNKAAPESSVTSIETQVNAPGSTIHHIGDIFYGYTSKEVKALLDEMQRAHQPKVWNGHNPYPGLNAFHESDANYFFGREKIVADLVKRVKKSRFIVIAGPSGSGKSSVARAGLLYTLGQGKIDGSQSWLLATMTPQGDPMTQLKLALQRATQNVAVGEQLALVTGEHPRALAQIIEEFYLTDDKRQRCLLLVDQFEELFTQTKDPAAQAAFIKLLTDSGKSADSRLIIVLSMRSDFVSHCVRYPELRDLMNEQLLLVGAMEPNELVAAISLPAMEVGTEIEVELVTQIMNDMKGEPGALPLMGFALRDLFEAEKTRVGAPMRLTLRSYLDRGGLEEALARHADRVFSEFSADQKRLAKNLFSRLIEVGQGRVDTRRTAYFAELVPKGVSAKVVHTFIRNLAREDVRLLTTNRDISEQKIVETDAADATVTIAHEKLIDAWPWLRQLVDENREIIALRNQINDDARMWKREQDASFLYRGARLLQVEEQLETINPYLDASAQAFIQESLIYRQQKLDEKEAQRQRELEKERALADEQRRRAEEAEKAKTRLSRRRNIAVAFAVVAGLIAILAAAFYLESNRNATRAENNLATATVALGEAESEKLRADNNAATAEAERQNAEAAQGTAEAEATRALSAEATAEAGREEAERQAQISLGLSLAALAPRFAEDVAGQDDELATLLGLEALWINQQTGGTFDGLLDGALRPILTQEYFASVVGNHDGSTILATAFSPDGRTVASAGYDNAVRLWSLSEPEATSGTTHPIVLRGYSSQVNSVAFSPDGQLLATASDHDVRLWDMSDVGATENLTASVTLRGHQSFVQSVAFSPDGRTLASASSDGTIRLSDVSDRMTMMNRVESLSLTGHEGGVRSVAFSPNGRTLASASWDKTVRLWDVSNWAAQDELDAPIVLEEHSSFVSSVAFAPDGQTLASGGSGGKIMLWNLSDPTLDPIVLEGFEDHVLSLAFAPDGATLASAGSKRETWLWDMTDLTADPIIIEGHQGRVRSVAFAPDGQSLVTGGDDSIVRLWNLSEPTSNARFSTHIDLQGNTYPHAVRAIAFSPNGEMLASAGDAGRVRLWDLSNLMTADKSTTFTSLRGSEGIEYAIAFAPDSQSIVSAGGGVVKFWSISDLSTGSTIADGSTVWSVAFAPNGRMIAYATNSGRIHLLDLTEFTSTGKLSEVATFRGAYSPNTSLAFAPDSSTLASTGLDNTVRLWDLSDLSATPTVTHSIVLDDHTNRVETVAFSPDGKTLASAGWDGTVRLWSVSEPTAAPTILEGHQNIVDSVAFSPSGRLLASAGRDRTIRLWDMSDLTTAPIIFEGDASFLSVAFAPNEQLLASAGGDGTIRLWNLSHDQFAEAGCLLTHRNLTWTEWQRYLPVEAEYRCTCANRPIHPSVIEAGAPIAAGSCPLIES